MKRVIIIFTFLTAFSCTSEGVIIEEILFLHKNSNAQPSLVYRNSSLSLSWVSFNEQKKASLNLSRFTDGKWTKPQTIATGSDWFVNWADFPTHAINGNLILTSYLKKSASGTYNYDVVLSLQKLSGEKIKEDFESELDSATCDCCQTSIAANKNGPIVVYRDRDKKEVRDIYITRQINGAWEAPSPVHKDGWIINGCPVNGPKVAVNSNNLAVSWFTVSNENPIVNLSFSKSNGDSFSTPIKINDHDAIGRVDVAFLNEQEVIVSYMEGDDVGTYLRIKKVSINGKVSEPITISKIDGGRNTGVPQLEVFNSEIFIVWTVFVDEKNQLKSVKLSSKNI